MWFQNRRMKWKRTKSGQLAMKRQKQQELEQHELEKLLKEQEQHDNISHTQNDNHSELGSKYEDGGYENKGGGDNLLIVESNHKKQIDCIDTILDQTEVEEKHKQHQLQQKQNQEQQQKLLNLDKDSKSGQKQHGHFYQEPSHESNESKVNTVSKLQVEIGSNSRSQDTRIIETIQTLDRSENCVTKCEISNKGKRKRSEDLPNVTNSIKFSDRNDELMQTSDIRVLTDLVSVQEDSFMRSPVREFTATHNTGMSPDDILFADSSLSACSNVSNFDECYSDISTSSSTESIGNSSASYATNNHIYSNDNIENGLASQNNQIRSDCMLISDMEYKSCGVSSFPLPESPNSFSQLINNSDSDISLENSYLCISDNHFLQVNDASHNNSSNFTRFCLPEYNLISEEEFRGVSLTELNLENLFDNGEFRVRT